MTRSKAEPSVNRKKCKNAYIGHSPLKLFRFNINSDKYVNITRLRIPTGVRQTSWLFTSIAEKWNSGLPRTTSVNGQNRISTYGFQIQCSNHSATLPPIQVLRVSAKNSAVISFESLVLHTQNKLVNLSAVQYAWFQNIVLF